MNLFDIDNVLPFIFICLFIDVFVFHHFRIDGDVFDSSTGWLSTYINCCLCHGFAIGFIVAMLFSYPEPDAISWISGACISSISALTYRTLVLKE